MTELLLVVLDKATNEGITKVLRFLRREQVADRDHKLRTSLIDMLLRGRQNAFDVTHALLNLMGGRALEVFSEVSSKPKAFNAMLSHHHSISFASDETAQEFLDYIKALPYWPACWARLSRKMGRTGLLYRNLLKEENLGIAQFLASTGNWQSLDVETVKEAAEGPYPRVAAQSWGNNEVLQKLLGRIEWPSMVGELCNYDPFAARSAFAGMKRRTTKVRHTSPIPGSPSCSSISTGTM